MSGGWCEDCGGARGRGRSVSRARADTTATDTERIYIYGQRRQLRRLRTACCLLVHVGVALSQTHTATAVVEATSLFLLTFPILPLVANTIPSPAAPSASSQPAHALPKPSASSHTLTSPLQRHPNPSRRLAQPATMAYMLYSIAFFVLAVGTSTHPHPCPIHPHILALQI